MSKKHKHDLETRIQIVKEYQSGQISLIQIGKKYGLRGETVRRMVKRYETEGTEGLRNKSKNKKYPKELKLKAVTDYLSGKRGLLEICCKYEISAIGVLQSWIKWYNGHKEFKERSSSKGEVYMTKGRKTTQEERAEIVAFCIEHGKDYGLTIEQYQVSYQQIYSWVKKYEEKGVNGLTDRRGKAKPENELTEEERLRQENKILQAKIKDQEMEIALLKKLRELRGGDW